MSSDTASGRHADTASRPDTAALDPEALRAQAPAARRPVPDPKPGRHERQRDRAGRAWAWATAGAAFAFCVALVMGAMRLYVDVTDVTDTPERTVDAFLEALLDQRDAEAAAAWLCADKADRDLSEAVAALSFIDGPGEFDWGEVAETGRSVGAATVSADIRIGGGDDGSFSAPTTWVFSLVAEEGEPQWLICGITAQ